MPKHSEGVAKSLLQKMPSDAVCHTVGRCLGSGLRLWYKTTHRGLRLRVLSVLNHGNLTIIFLH